RDRARYKNLCPLLTGSKLRIVGRQPDGSPKYLAKGERRITFENLKKHGRGPICLAGGSRSPLTRALPRRASPTARRATEEYIRVDTSLSRLAAPFRCRCRRRALNHKLIALVERCRIQVTATDDVCYAGTARRTADVDPTLA